jgi:predicted O-methyltransferase YrrM
MAIDGIETYTDPLIKLAKRLKPKNILEIGFGYEGYSNQVWMDHTSAQITTIDKGDWQQVASKRAEAHSDRLTFILGRSEEVMPTIKDKFDLIYIDGDHRYDGAKADMLNAIPLLTKKGVIVLDDYGVTTEDAVDLDDNGQVQNGSYGVKQAADEVFAGWEQVFTDINFANGGRAYAQAKPRKR